MGGVGEKKEVMCREKVPSAFWRSGATWPPWLQLQKMRARRSGAEMEVILFASIFLPAGLTAQACPVLLYLGPKIHVLFPSSYLF